MSLLNYFQRQKNSKDGKKLSEVCESLTVNLPENITVKEVQSVQNTLNVTVNKKRSAYGEKEKQEIAKYALTHGNAAAVRKFRKSYPNLNESTVRPWVKRYRESLKEKEKIKR